MERQKQLFMRVVRGAMLPFCVVVLIGCGHLDMYDQAKYNPYEADDQIFGRDKGGDGAASRPLVADTFARGQPLSSSSDVTGKDASGAYIDNPISINDAVLARGKDRYTIYCVPCHGELGNGKGIAASYFATAKHPVPSYYDQRLVNEKDGYFFDVITNGKNANQGGMFPYASRVHIADRWAIIHYIRSLQQDPPQGAIPPPPKPTVQGGAQPNATAGAAETAPAATAAP